jgi:hypothetical protein
MSRFGTSIVLGALAFAGIAVTANAQQSTPVRSGSYAGSMTQLPTGGDYGRNHPCVVHRPLNLTVEGDKVTFSYVNWGGSTIHFRGKIDAAGAVNAWHTNDDGSRSILTGKIESDGFAGYVARDEGRCNYKVTVPVSV